MGCWLFGCFKWRKRRPCHTSASTDEAAVRAVEEKAFPNQHGVGTAVDNSFKARIELESSLKADNVLEKEASASLKVGRKQLSVGRRSSDALDQLEAELESLTQKLEHEADNAQNLTNQVKSLQKWGELLESPNALKNAMETLCKSSNYPEEDQHATLLQSLISKIELKDNFLQPSQRSNDKEQMRCIDQALDNQTIAADITNLGCMLNKTRLCNTSALCLEASQTPGGKAMEHNNCPCGSDNSGVSRILESCRVDSPSTELADATFEEIVEVQSEIVSMGHKENKVIKQDGPSFTTNLNKLGYTTPRLRMDEPSSPGCLEGVEDRKSCSALSFSGFIVVEGEGSNRFSCDQLSVINGSASGDLSGPKACRRIIECSDLSSKSLDEASKCLFAFSPPNTSQTPSESVASSLSNNGEAVSMEIFHGHVSDSDVESHSEMHSVFASSTALTNEGTTSVKTSTWHGDSNGLDVHALQRASCTQDSLVEGDCGMFSDESQSSAECSIQRKELCGDLLSVETSHRFYHQTLENSALSVKPLDLDAAEPIISMGKGNSTLVTHEQCSNAMHEETQRQVRRMLISSEGKQNDMTSPDSLKPPMFSKEPPMTEILEEAMSPMSPRIHPQELEDDATSKQDPTPLSPMSIATPQLLTLPDSRHLPLLTVHESTQPLIASSSTSASSSPTHTSFTPQHSLFQVKSRGRACKLQLTPSHETRVSVSQVETPSDDAKAHKLVEDRPIMGTVAAHWSHSSTQKWWDGKGIPNSTNKYKEDQRVSWHATPFEVRLERALAKQERVFQKKLFPGGMATELEVSSGPIPSPN